MKKSKIQAGMFDYAVVIGRMQPLHNGHLALLLQAARRARQVIVVLGSANRPRSARNPFTVAERAAMVAAVMPQALIASVEDTLYNDTEWAAGVQSAVAQEIRKTWMPAQDEHKPTVVLIGHARDASSYYLEMFPQWQFENLSEQANGVSATAVREHLYTDIEQLNQLVPPVAIHQMLVDFSRTEAFATVKAEAAFLAHYRQQFAALPYPPVFVTVDAVVVQSGHLLLIQRRAQPGKGLWALPGGFINQSERLEAAMLRELREETQINCPLPVLRGSIVAREVFDHADRSQRGRTITHAFLLHLRDGDLHQVAGGDDAAKAQWLPLSEVERMGDRIYEDHLDIIRRMIGLLAS